ncbi:MAG: serine/threonine protein kinase [Bythopirellula sp.]
MQLTRIGPFALEEPLDGSATSKVLRGVHIERQVSMAIKLLPPSVNRQVMGRSSFPDDIKKLQTLEHPGLTRVLGGACEQGQPYLVLELVRGESLRERLDRRGKLPWEMTMEIVEGLSDALMYAHAHGVVHQRITPARILLPESGGVKLIGFDCKWSDHDDVVGSRCPMEIAHYLSPEQFRGRQSAGYPQCDLFSLGVVLYECLTGEVPWAADTPDALRQARRDGPAPRISTKLLDCPVWLDVLAERLLAKVRSQRLQSAEETHRAIINAKRKVDAGTGAAAHAWSGKRGALSVDEDRTEIKKLKKKKTKRRDASPFYEQAWFLAASLVLLVGVGAWALWPPNEAELYAAAKPLMDSDNPVDWKRAQEQFVDRLLDRFPDTNHLAEIQVFADRYAMHRAEERIKNLSRFAREPKTESERAFAAAWEYERFGDRMTAWQKYESLIELFSDSRERDDRIYVMLAKRQIARLKFNQKSSSDQQEFLEEALGHAKQLAEDGDLLAARRKLDSVITLYATNQELGPFVEQARQQLRQLDAGAAQ